MGQGLHCRLACRRGHSVSGDANGAALHHPGGHPDRRRRVMLSALGLVRAMDGGKMTPAQAFELCAEAIEAREAEIGAFAALDLEAARKAASAAAKSKPLRGLAVG